jgi:hypothetical protein
MTHERIISGWLGGVAHSSDRARRSEAAREEREQAVAAAERPEPSATHRSTD